MEDEARSHSLAVTANELARVQTILDNTAKYDFVLPQGTVTSTILQNRNVTAASRAFMLRQTAPNTQTLTSIAEPTSITYTISFKAKGGFLKNKIPHIYITKGLGGGGTSVDARSIPFAESRLESYGFNTTITFRQPELPQALILKDTGRDRFQFSIGDTLYRWQPLGPSINVLELVREAGGKVALFVYSENVTPRRGSLPGNVKRYGSEDLGEIHIVDSSEGGPEVLEEILASAVVVVEKLRRRALRNGC